MSRTGGIHKRILDGRDDDESQLAASSSDARVGGLRRRVRERAEEAPTGEPPNRGPLSATVLLWHEVEIECLLESSGMSTWLLLEANPLH